jgi:glucokinase-like ROK family protein
MEIIDSAMPVDEVISILISNIKKACESCARQIGENFLGLALGVPGLVDFNTGQLLFAPNLNWKNVALREYLRSEFNAPIFIDNEANLATLGEYYFGAAYQNPDVLYISAGVGLGGGILREAHLLRGVAGMAGEFGHITMDTEGEICGCGNRGCWETQASQRALFRYVARALGENRESVLWERTRHDLKELNVAMIVTAAQDGDQVARESLEKVGHYLGIGIASMVNALNPGIVVFGGIMSIAWEYLEPAISSEMSKRALLWNREGTQIVLAQHGKNACVMGGIATVYHAIISQPNAV